MEPMSQPPPMVPQHDQGLRDAEHIRLLVVFHYVVAGLMGLTACIPILHLVMGTMLVNGAIPMGTPPSGSGPAPDPAMLGWIFVAVASVIILAGWTLAVLVFFAGRKLSERRNWTFVFVVACVQCLWMPIGTTLGVFTIIVLQRPSVKGLFGERDRNVPSPYSKT